VDALQAHRVDAFVYDKPLLTWLVLQDYLSMLYLPEMRLGTQNYSIALPEGSALRPLLNAPLLEQTQSNGGSRHSYVYGGRWEGLLGWFPPDRLGFNLAWLALIYISFQLLSIPFVLRASKDRFIGVLDGLASIVPLGITLIVIVGKPELLRTADRWEAAFLLLLIASIDLFGGYTFNLALSRMMDFAPVGN
jgi:hypothetical protein